jgi:hypothetical protein
MDEKIKSLVDECSVFEMLDGRILVHPLPLRTYESTSKEPDYEKAKADGLNPMEDEMPMKQKIYDVNYAYQRAIVLKVFAKCDYLNVGDIIIYKVSNLLAFDILPEVSMLKGYEVVAIEHFNNNKNILHLV